ncbi:MAG TPA: hypothetical protein VMT46_18690 [Anaerolineaceae bacterium]|nr:hypothetical protein [Anaerolineaceae bacterium]
MSAGKVIAYIVAAILILFGVLMMLGATNPDSGQIGWLPVGVILIGIGLVMIYLVGRKSPATQSDNVTLKIDLPGDVNLDSLKCKQCGGTLTAENIQMVNGAPMVTCPYCHSVYQLTEQPKW